MRLGFRCLPSTDNGLATDEAAILSIAARLGMTPTVWNSDGAASLTSTTNVASTWPSTFQLDAVASGAAAYIQIHFNQSAGSGGASDLTWPDLLDASRPLHATCVSQMQALADRLLTMSAQSIYLVFHHEPEDDAQVNGFGAGDPWLGASGTYNGITGIAATTTVASIAPGSTVGCSGGGSLPASGALYDPTTGAAFTYTLGGSTLTVGTVLKAGAVNSGNTLQQAWTQKLAAQSGDTGQAQAAANLFAAASAAAWSIWAGRGLTVGGSSPLIARVVNLMSGTTENGHFGGSPMWPDAANAALAFDVLSLDAYTQPGNGDTLHIGTNGRQTPDQLAGIAYAWCAANGKKFALGEHGIAAVYDSGTKTHHSDLSDSLSKAYYFRYMLLPWLGARRHNIEFVCFQGDIMYEVTPTATVATGGTYTGPINIPTTSVSGVASSGVVYFPRAGIFAPYDSWSGTTLHITGNTVTLLAGDTIVVWQGRHAYGDWDDGNQAVCTNAMQTLVNSTLLNQTGGDVNVFPYFKQVALDKNATDTVDMNVDTLKVVLVSGYTYSATHKYMSDAITAGATEIARSGALTSPTIVNGTFDAADVTIAAVATGHTITGVLLIKDTGTNASSVLVAHIDQNQSAGALSLATNGSDVTVTFDAAGIFDL